MYKHILVPTDGSKLSLKAAKEAARLAQKLGARITALYVIEPYMPPATGETAFLIRQAGLEESYAKAMKKHAATALAQVEMAAAAAKVRCDGIAVSGFRPWEAIIKAARAKKCDLIVMASHGWRGLAGLILGGETHKVLTHAKTPVLVCR
jgi:nucleotide-binding universal stress UspA family protein